jgi:ribosome modulation factor
MDLNHLTQELKEKVQEAGYQAYWDGSAKDENPYCDETQVDAFENWEMGWLRADADSDDE